MAYTTRFGKLVKLKLDGFAGVRKAPDSKLLMKGKFMGRCNRSACLAPGADWYNRGSYAFYCEDCAEMLNHANRNDEFCKDAPLCHLVASSEDAAKCFVMR